MGVGEGEGEGEGEDESENGGEGEGDGDGDGDGNLENHGRWAMGRVVRVLVQGLGSGWVVGWFGGGCIGVVPSVRRQEGKAPAESNLTNQYLGFKGIARPIIPD